MEGEEAAIACLSYCERYDALAASAEVFKEPDTVILQARTHPSNLTQSCMSGTKRRIERTKVHLPDELHTHSEVKVHFSGQSVNDNSPIRQSRDSFHGFGSQMKDAHKISKLYKAAQNAYPISSRQSIITFISLVMDEQQFQVEMAKLEEAFRTNRRPIDDDDEDSDSVYSLDSGYESPIGWEGSNATPPLNCLGLINGSIEGDPFKKQNEQPTTMHHSYITEMQREDRISIGLGIADTGVKSFSLQDEGSRQRNNQRDHQRDHQREYIKFAANCASKLLVATPTTPTSPFRRLIQLPIFRNTKRKAVSKGISHLDEPWTYELRREEVDSNSLSTSFATTSSKRTQSTQQSDILKPPLRHRAYTSYHGSEGYASPFE